MIKINPADAPFLAKRQLLISGKITYDVQEEICGYIHYLNAIGEGEITVFIDSTGGDLYAELYIGDAISTSRSPVTGIVTGVAYSAGFGILFPCKMRKAYPHAQFMFHAPSVDTPIDDPQFRNLLQRVRSVHAEQLRNIASLTRQSHKKVQRWAKEERHFTAQEALRLGLIHEIVTAPP